MSTTDAFARLTTIRPDDDTLENDWPLPAAPRSSLASTPPPPTLPAPATVTP